MAVTYLQAAFSAVLGLVVNSAIAGQAATTGGVYTTHSSSTAAAGSKVTAATNRLRNNSATGFDIVYLANGGTPLGASQTMAATVMPGSSTGVSDIAMVAVRIQTGANTMIRGGRINNTWLCEQVVAGTRTTIGVTTAGSPQNVFPTGGAFIILHTSGASVQFWVNGYCAAAGLVTGTGTMATGYCGYVLAGTAASPGDGVGYEFASGLAEDPLAKTHNADDALNWTVPLGFLEAGSGASATRRTNCQGYGKFKTDADRVYLYLDQSHMDTLHARETLAVAYTITDANGSSVAYECQIGQNQTTIMLYFNPGNSAMREYEWGVQHHGTGSGGRDLWTAMASPVAGVPYIHLCQTGFAVTSGAGVVAPTIKPNLWACCGNSIEFGLDGGSPFAMITNGTVTQVFHLQGSSFVTNRGNRWVNSMKMLANANNAELAMIAFPSQGYEQAAGVVPKFSTAFDLWWAGQARDWTTYGSLVKEFWCPHGENDHLNGISDATLQASVYTSPSSGMLPKFRTAFPNAHINLCAPPSGHKKTPLAAAVAAYKADHPADVKAWFVPAPLREPFYRNALLLPSTVTGLFNNMTIESIDGIHPSGPGVSAWAVELQINSILQRLPIAANVLTGVDRGDGTLGTHTEAAATGGGRLQRAAGGSKSRTAGVA